MNRKLIKKLFLLVFLLGMTTCFCACSSEVKTMETVLCEEPKKEQVYEKEETIIEFPKDEKAPEGILKTWFYTSSEEVFPSDFTESVTDESEFKEGFRNITLVTDDPMNFEAAIPTWSVETDCYEEKGVDVKNLQPSFVPDKDGLYSLEVVGADCHGNASVTKVYVLYLKQETSMPWLDTPSYDEAPEKKEFTGFDRAKAEQAFAKVNENRVANGLPALLWDESLYDLACIRAQEIVTSFSHQRPDGSYVGDVIIRQMGASGCGENIAANYRSITNLINGWMNSPGHRETMLDNRFSSGVMACYCKEGTCYWVNLFRQ